MILKPSLFRYFRKIKEFLIFQIKRVISKDFKLKENYDVFLFVKKCLNSRFSVHRVLSYHFLFHLANYKIDDVFLKDLILKFEHILLNNLSFENECILNMCLACYWKYLSIAEI